MSELLAKETIEVRGIQLTAVLEAINVRQGCATRSEKKAHEAASGSALMLTPINNQISLSSYERVAIWRFGAEDAMFSPPVHLWIEDILQVPQNKPLERWLRRQCRFEGMRLEA